MTTRTFSIYIHVPFCAQKCPYCDFNTYAVERTPEHDYTQAVCGEIAAYSGIGTFAGRSVRTVFFGGGTPSLFSGESIARILETIATHFRIEQGAEITVEANPNVADASRLSAYQKAGVNRISFGVQSFNEKYLTLLGRNHSSQEAHDAVGEALRIGIRDVSIDLMYGLPGQSFDELRSDLRMASKLAITHLSTYCLTIEPGTPFFQRRERGLLNQLPENDVADMLELIPEELATYGFTRYEISNYTRGDNQSQHNTVYWTGGDYLGIGAGAHSYVACYSPSGMLETAERWSNLALPASYMTQVNNRKAVSWRETLDQRALSFEFFYLGLRRTAGVTRSTFTNLFGERALRDFETTLQALSSEGFLELSQDSIRLTTRGVAVADSVFERLSG